MPINYSKYRIARVPPSSDLLSWNQVFNLQQYKPVVDLIKDKNKKLNILDCGANAGYAAVYFQKAFPYADILAVELDRDNFRMLNQNFYGRTLLGGVWSRDCYLSVKHDFGDRKEWSYYAEEDDAGDVPGHSIHELIGGHVDILKMDIEGGEKEVFKDDSFLEHVDIIAIEIHDQFKCRPMIYSSLMKHGFEFEEHGELTVGCKI